MPNKELIEFINKSRAIGETDEQIKAILKQQGWQDAALNEAFSPKAPVMPPAQPAPIRQSTAPVINNFSADVAEKKSTTGKVALLSSIVVILLIGIAFVIYYLLVLNK
jgi:hypothetical protein